MNHWKITLLALLPALLAPLAAVAQLGGFSDVPIEITSDGETRFEGGVAVAEDNVSILYSDVSIFCDYAQYNPDTRDILLRGHVRIYRNEFVFSGERAVYNLESKTLRAADFSGGAAPVQFSAETVSSLGAGAYRVRDGILTTDDSADPHWHLKAKGMRIYPDDRVILTNVTMKVGRVPVLWFPYMYQSLRKDMAFTITPGYDSNWGAYALTQYAFPITDTSSGRLRLDARSERGFAIGLDSDLKFGKDNRSYGKFTSYLADDTNPEESVSGRTRPPIDSTRYRVSFESRTYLTEDISAIIDVNKLSDAFVLEDFYPSEFVTNPQPDNVVALGKYDENYTITAIVRGQLNDFQPTTERLPEVVLDIKRQPFFGTPIFYEGETGIANLRQRGADFTDMPEYDAIRFDSLHQFLYPRTYFGWLSFIPRIGFRGTYYSDSGRIENVTTTDIFDPAGILIPAQPAVELVGGGSKTQASVIAGFESSFKVSKSYDGVRSRLWGLDGLRHIIQPYTNFSFVSDPGSDPLDILQFDRLIPSTQIPPIDFPQFLAVDSIDQWSIWRFGVRNRLQTRRDGNIFSWLETDTFFDANIDNPYDDTNFSNVVGRLGFRPLPWAGLNLDAQLPVFDSGFTQVNTRLDFMVNRNIGVQIGQRYLFDSPFFQDSNLITFGGYWRINENWGVSMSQQFEADDSTLESQRYVLSRDLSSWVASIGAVIRDNTGGASGGDTEFGLLLTFTLKDFPQLNLPFNLDPQGASGN